MTQVKEKPQIHKVQPSEVERVYTIVRKHMLAQNAKSLEYMNQQYVCAYRTSDGRQCAVGCLIPLEHYTPEIEGVGVESDSVLETLDKSGVATWLPGVKQLLRLLQSIHDANSPNEWRACLDTLATYLPELSGGVTSVRYAQISAALAAHYTVYALEYDGGLQT